MITEGTGTAPAIRVSNAWGGDLNQAQVVPLRDLGLNAFQGGRSYFAGNGGGTAAPGYASTAAWGAGSTGGYRTGSTAVLIDDGGVAGQHSTNCVIERVRWINFDEPLKWGNNTFAITLRDCLGEDNNKGLSWSQTAGLNSMEKIVVEGGDYSNNNYGLYIVAIFTDGGGTSQPQGGSWFVRNISLDYNLVAQGVITLAPAGNGYPQSSFHLSGSHIENNAATLGAASPWFALQGVGRWADNEIYINGAAPSTGLVSIGDNSSGSMVNNRIGGSALLFYSTSSNYKDVSALGNICNDIGSPVIALRDGAGTALQAINPTDTPTVDWYQDNLVLDPVAHGNMVEIFLSSGCTKLTLPPSGAGSMRVGKTLRIHNKSTAAVITQIPAGVFCGGMNTYVDNRSGSATVTGASIPANSEVVLKQAAMGIWAYMGGFAASQPS